nr:ATP-binding protein [Nitrosomonas nitrosa]
MVWLIAAVLGMTAIIAGYLLYADMQQQRDVLREVRAAEALRTSISELNSELQQLHGIVSQEGSADSRLESVRVRIEALEDAWVRSGRSAGDISLLVTRAQARLDEALEGNDDKTPQIDFQTEALRVSSLLSAITDPRQSEERDRSAQWRLIAGALVLLMALALALAIISLLRALRAMRRLLRNAEDQSQRLQAMFNGSADGMLSLDPDGRILDMNRSARAMLGDGLKTYAQQAVTDLVVLGEFDELTFQEAAAQLRAKEDQVHETEVIRHDGSRFRAGLMLGSYYVEGRQHYIATIRDITRRKMLEEAKNAFVATVSHELRTPLTSIAGSLDLLQARSGKEAMSDPSRRLIDIAQTNARRLIALINDILDIEKLESGRAAIELEDVSLRELAAEAVEANAALGASRNVLLDLIDSADVIVRADRARLMQVATNFISNAVKFSPDGGRVTLSVSRSGEMGELTVSDQGPGVPEAFQAHLFEKFSQAEDARSKGQGSTGLGLAISREIAERLGGSVGYSTADEGGARFSVRIPATRLAQADLSADSGLPLVLHFDPDHDMLRVVADAFDGTARIVSISAAGELAEAARDHKPDLIVYDVGDRPKLLRSEIDRIAERYGPLPILAFTSLERETIPDLPYDRLLVKSCTPVSSVVALALKMMDRSERGS